MKSVSASPERPSQTTRRLTSLVRRDVRDGRAVYVKQFVEDAWEGSTQTIQNRAGREAEVIGRLAELPAAGKRLGRVRLVDCDQDSAMVVTEEVPGSPLDQPLLNRFCRHPGVECRIALLLAGRWLRIYQQLSHTPENSVRLGDNSPADLVDYCDIRLRKLQSLNYRWITNARREAVLDTVTSLRAAADPTDRQDVWCHGDYAPGNIMWDGRVLTPIDFTMANLGAPLLDVTYFLHRLEMLRIYFPWKRWPIDLWKRAFLRGYGRPDAEQSPMFRALMIRHLLCRLQTYVRRPPDNLKQKLHAKWIRWCVRNRLLKELVLPLDAD